MAMEYARLYFDFFNCEKVQYLIDICGDSGVVCLQRLWIRAGQRNNDGVFVKSARALEKIAGWKGKPGLLVDTLVDLDFPLLDIVGEKKYQLHNWEENNPHLTEKAKEKRSKRASKAALTRWEGTKDDDATSMLQECSEDAHCMPDHAKGMLGDANLTKRNLTKRNLTNKNTVEQTEELIDKILNFWKEESGRNISIKTKDYRSQVKARIDQLKREKGIREEEDIFQAFVYVIRNKKKQADDPDHSRFSPPDWNIRTLTRPKNFIAYLDEVEYVRTLSKKQKAAKADEEWINEKSD